MPVQAFSVPKKLLLGLATLLVSAALLAACGSDSPAADTSGLEVIRATVAPTTAGAAATTADNAVAVATAATTTTAPVTTASATTAAATTASKTTAAATTVNNTTTAAATTANNTTSAAKTTAPATTKAPAAAATTPAIKKGVLLEPMSWKAQTWNNCAPMSAVMSLSYYGVTLTEEQCAKALRPNPTDKHVRPEELVAFIQKQGFKTVERENGTLDILRALLSAGIPVITQQWLQENDDIGHYRVARGYDLSKGILIFNDSMDRHPNTQVTNEEQEKLWKGYDHRYFPVYTAAQEATVMAILGEDANAQANMNRAMTAARKYVDANPKDIDGWRNYGYLQFAMGDYKGAINTWEQQITKMLKSSENGPYNRFLWYQLWPMESYNKLGNYQKVIQMAPNEIEKTKGYAEARYEYAYALNQTGRKDEAIAQLKKGLIDDPNYSPINDLLAKLGVAA
jgi:tetratricopeptide (TPR) repeat protein